MATVKLGPSSWVGASLVDPESVATDGDVLSAAIAEKN